MVLAIRIRIRGGVCVCVGKRGDMREKERVRRRYMNKTQKVKRTEAIDDEW